MEKNVILEDVLREFGKLAQIPRPSGHEKQVSDYIAARLRSMGLKAEQDEHGNVIAEKTAAAGFADVPLIMLQSHMDMVCIADPGVDYDPLRDAVKIKNDGRYLSAEGTSLGADDGIGVAEIFYILSQDFAHGPLRAVFTVDEEQGMTGARGLGKKYLNNVKYLINCDSEDYDVVTVGSAGSVRISLERKLDGCCSPEGTCGLRIGVKNLLGGHSGTEIGRNRCNAVKMLANILQQIQAQDIYFDIADIKGGTADNAIASNAAADIACRSGDKEPIRHILGRAERQFGEIYGRTEKDAVFIFEETAAPEKVLAAETGRALISLLCVLHSGVYAMSALAEGLPELSSNIGRINISENKINIRLLSRSATNANLVFIKETHRILAELSGFTAVFSPTSPAWNGDPASRLAQLTMKIFEKQNGRPMRSEFIHGGLECNYFADKNPDIDIISIGPNNIDIHTPQERLQLDSVVPQVLLMKGIIKQIAQDGK